ncbi:hypothetical protein, partial [Thermosulfuriphilus sp.]
SFIIFFRFFRNRDAYCLIFAIIVCLFLLGVACPHRMIRFFVKEMKVTFLFLMAILVFLWSLPIRIDFNDEFVVILFSLTFLFLGFASLIPALIYRTFANRLLQKSKDW